MPPIEQARPIVVVTTVVVAGDETVKTVVETDVSKVINALVHGITRALSQETHDDTTRKL